MACTFPLLDSCRPQLLAVRQVLAPGPVRLDFSSLEAQHCGSLPVLTASVKHSFAVWGVSDPPLPERHVCPRSVDLLITAHGKFLKLKVCRREPGRGLVPAGRDPAPGWRDVHVLRERTVLPPPPVPVAAASVWESRAALGPIGKLTVGAVYHPASCLGVPGCPRARREAHGGGCLLSR